MVSASLPPQSARQLHDDDAPPADASSAALLPLLRDVVGDADATVHGLRGTFRTWCADMSGFESEVCEHALAHL